jgi:GT2 family glycosyltransferase
VTWNAGAVLERCLESIRAQRVEGELETIVVDNASDDETAEVLARHDWVNAIRNERNVGFSLGNNQGAAEASGEVLHFLNADTELLDPRALQRLGDALEESGAALAGPRLVNPDGTLQPSCSAHPTVVRALLVAAGVHWLLPNRALARVFPRHWSHDESREVDWVIGAALTVRSDLFREVGGFWPIQYAQEQDLARELERRGHSVHFVHDVDVMHVGSFSARQRWSDPEVAGRMAEAELAFLAKHYSRPRRGAIRLFTWAGHAARSPILRVAGRTARADEHRAMARVYAGRSATTRS